MMIDRFVVLVADNNPVDRAQIVEAVLAARPTARIVEAESGREAIRLMHSLRVEGTPPALCILDLYMSPVSGREAAEYARKRKLTARVVTSLRSLSSRGARETTDKREAVASKIAEWVQESGWMDDGEQTTEVKEEKPRRRARLTTWWARIAFAAVRAG
jgi:CheY-like chemotaxis protein